MVHVERGMRVEMRGAAGAGARNRPGQVGRTTRTCRSSIGVYARSNTEAHPSYTLSLCGTGHYESSSEGIAKIDVFVNSEYREIPCFRIAVAALPAWHGFQALLVQVHASAIVFGLRHRSRETSWYCDTWRDFHISPNRQIELGPPGQGARSGSEGKGQCACPSRAMVRGCSTSSPAWRTARPSQDEALDMGLA
jgi:hypothetical protein